MTTKAPGKDKTPEKNTAPVQGAEGELNFDDLAFDAPVEGMRLGETFLYRPGDIANPKPGIFPPGHRQAGKAHCGLFPIQGYLVEAVERESDEFGEYEQIVMVLTKGGVGIDGDKLKRLEKGQMITFTSTGNLKDVLRYSKHPTHSAEMYIRPTGETRKTKRGQMRVWEQVVTQVVERALIKIPRLPQLPEGDPDSFEPKQLGN